MNCKRQPLYRRLYGALLVVWNNKEQQGAMGIHQFVQVWTGIPTTTLSTNEFLSIRRSRLLPTSFLPFGVASPSSFLLPTKKKKTQSLSRNHNRLMIGTWTSTEWQLTQCPIEWILSHTHKKKNASRAEIQKKESWAETWQRSMRVSVSRSSKKKTKNKKNKRKCCNPIKRIYHSSGIPRLHVNLPPTHPSFSHCYHSIERS